MAAWWTPGPAPAPPGSGLGLDLERIDAPALAAPDGLGGVGFSTAERTWLAGLAPADRPAARARLWTRKEALVKAVEAFRRTFASGEQMLGAQVAEPEEEPAAERTTEQLVVKRG